MKTWRKISGVVSIIFFLSALNLAGSVRFAEKILNMNDSLSSTFKFMAVMLLIGGIFSLVLSKSEENLSSMIIAVVYAAAAIVGFIKADINMNLYALAGWCGICATVAIAVLIRDIKLYGLK